MTFTYRRYKVVIRTLNPFKDGNTRPLQRVFLCLPYGQVSGNGNIQDFFVVEFRAAGSQILVVFFLINSKEAYYGNNKFTNFLYRKIDRYHPTRRNVFAGCIALYKQTAGNIYARPSQRDQASPGRIEQAIRLIFNIYNSTIAGAKFFMQTGELCLIGYKGVCK
ncbi:MAG: hypothetical protein AAF195_01420 [Pseudomonadota bacterium]